MSYHQDLLRKGGIWTCNMHPDPELNRCDIPEKPVEDAYELSQSDGVGDSSALPSSSQSSSALPSSQSSSYKSLSQSEISSKKQLKDLLPYWALNKGRKMVESHEGDLDDSYWMLVNEALVEECSKQPIYMQIRVDDLSCSAFMNALFGQMKRHRDLFHTRQQPEVESEERR
jgi:hypothetical protein